MDDTQTLGLGNESQLHDEQIVIDAVAEKFCPGIHYHQAPAASGGSQERWQSRRLVCTKGRLYFFKEGLHKVLDLIPLVEIDRIERVPEHGTAAHVKDAMRSAKWQGADANAVTGRSASLRICACLASCVYRHRTF